MSLSTQFCYSLFVHTVLGDGIAIVLMHAGTLDMQPRA